MLSGRMLQSRYRPAHAFQAAFAGAERTTMSQTSETLPDMNAVLADAEQSLTRLVPEPPINFRFYWQGIPFAARVDNTEAGLRLRLVGDLGPVPFSVENAPGRDRLLSLVQWGDANGTCRFVVGRRHHLNLLGDARITAPLTGTAIIATATSFLLQARPYIDLAAEQRPN
jgi:hypothetical protein